MVYNERMRGLIYETDCQACGKLTAHYVQNNTCVPCARSKARAGYWNDPDYWRSRSRKQSQDTRVRLASIKVERGCADCGYNTHPDALEFDHTPGTIKLFAVSNVGTRSWISIEQEIAKCEVVCSNCHHVRTANRR